MNKYNIKKFSILFVVFLFVQLVGVFSTKTHESYAFMNRFRGFFSRFAGFFRTSRPSDGIRLNRDVVVDTSNKILLKTSNPREGQIKPIPDSNEVDRTLHSNGKEFLTLLSDGNLFTELYKDDDLQLRSVRTKDGNLITEWFSPNDGKVMRREYRDNKKVITTKFLSDGSSDVKMLRRKK